MATESFLCIPPGKQKHFDQPQVGGRCIFFFFLKKERERSPSQQLLADYPSTLGSRVQQLVDLLSAKCVEMYLFILKFLQIFCLFACCKVIDSVVGGQLWMEGAEDRCIPIQVSALWRCSSCTANVVEMSARISLRSHISVILLTTNLQLGTIYQAELAGVTLLHTPMHRWQWITTCIILR